MSSQAPDLQSVPQPGETLAGKYQIERTLGQGGMGVVLAARHLDLNQRVAIKFMAGQLSRHPAAVARFLREARAAAAIQSEHVARVIDVTRTEAGIPYIVMEYLEGTDLDQLVRARGPLPIDETLDYVLQACEALAEAHAAGIIHRDLKPGNLFLARRADGSPLVKVLDFGMSKVTVEDGAAAPQEGSLTSPADVLGSPWYMSPEQVRSTKYVDARTDVWSLGIILHKLLTGSQAFEAETLSSCIVKIVTDPPIPLRTKLPNAPAELESVILRCLEKDLARRLQNVAELAWALLPLAPERARLSVERIVRVLLGSDVLTERTLPLSAAASAPFTAVPITAAPVAVAEPAMQPKAAAPEVVSTAASVSPAHAPAQPPRSTWPFIVASAFLVLAGAGLVAIRVLSSARGDPAALAATATASNTPTSTPSASATFTPEPPPATASPSTAAASPSATSAPIAPPITKATATPATAPTLKKAPAAAPKPVPPPASAAPPKHPGVF
jgi:eukaryotic-like serine/threonine-protein kinase